MEETEPSTLLRRFVVLRHDIDARSNSPRPTHLDWMFELDHQLRTFATAVIDSFIDPVEVLAEPLADHRLAYLDYEGPISGDRGAVTRLASGRYVLLRSHAGLWQARLNWEVTGMPTAVPGDPLAADAFPSELPRDHRMRSDVLFAESRGVWQLRLSPPR